MNENIKNEDILENEEVLEQERIEREQGELLYNRANERIDALGLNWTFRSVEYLIKRNKITFNQIRSCVFKNEEGEAEYDLLKATQYIIASGLVTAKTIDRDDYNKCMEEALDIIEEWRREFGFIGILQILLINRMEKDHFFMGTQDVQLLNTLSLKNIQKEMAMNTIAVDLQTKLAQSQAMQ